MLAISLRMIASKSLGGSQHERKIKKRTKNYKRSNWVTKNNACTAVNVMTDTIKWLTQCVWTIEGVDYLIFKTK